jgi:LytS/YehU family sensor histidine kinase
MNSVNGSSDRIENKGIGLQNVKRRLELLYPAKHQLKIENNKNSFSVNLELNV